MDDQKTSDKAEDPPSGSPDDEDFMFSAIAGRHSDHVKDLLKLQPWSVALAEDGFEKLSEEEIQSSQFLFIPLGLF